ncbi:MAG: hypothetical protein DHS20C11_23960 [Lysobacteraceae bacterium]|nr:MAG: hypothetical protein DHS20C11_23960 [Xanthomonadaceae bacterium]
MIPIVLALALLGSPQTDHHNALLQAISDGDTKQLTTLLDDSASTAPADAKPLIYAAVEAGRAHLVPMLVKRGADINARYAANRDATPLMAAISKNSPDLLVTLIEQGAKVDLRDSYGDPAINYAAYYGYLDLVEVLLEAGADTSFVGHGTAIEIAMRRGHQAMVATLAKHDGLARLPGADIEGWQAITRSDINLLKQLLDNGMDANGSGPYGRPVLAEAARQGSVEAIKVLIAAGADVDATDRINYTAFMEAAREGHLDAMKLLFDAGADINHAGNRNGMSLTATHLAAIEGHTDAIAWLADTGANLNAQGKDGGTAMMWALYEGETDAVVKLIELGADPDLEGAGGFSVRRAAVEYGIGPIVKALGSQGAYP